MVMRVTPTALPEVRQIESDSHTDARGSLTELFHAQHFAQATGSTLPFVQDNLTHSKHGVLRGLHFQQRQPQGKLVQVLAGRILDVAVDIRCDSPHFGQHVAMTLSGDRLQQLWIPPGFAHGFCVLSDDAWVLYKCTAFYDPDDQQGIAWNCPRLAIPWPVSQPLLSPRDCQLPTLDDWLSAQNTQQTDTNPPQFGRHK